MIEELNFRFRSKQREDHYAEQLAVNLSRYLENVFSIKYIDIYLKEITFSKYRVYNIEHILYTNLPRYLEKVFSIIYRSVYIENTFYRCREKLTASCSALWSIVLCRMCYLKNVFFIEYVIYTMCYLYNVFSVECVIYRICSQ
jgi:hypothetical protein